MPSLLVCIALKKLESLGFQFFVDDVVSGVDFRPSWPMLPGSGYPLLDGFFYSCCYWELG